MDINGLYIEPRLPVDKGKQRAATPEPSEQTPLLPSGSSRTIHLSRSRSPQEQLPHQSLLRRLLIVFLVTLVASLGVLSLVIFFIHGYSSRVSSLTVRDVLSRGLVTEGPSRIDVLNATREDGVWLRVSGRVGLDVGSVLRINPDDKDFAWTKLWKSLGRWGVRQVGVVSIELSQITVASSGKPSLTLATLTTPVVELSLSPDSPTNLGWLMSVSIPIRVHTTERAEDLVRFVKESWVSGNISVSGVIPTMRVTGGKVGEHTWKGNFNIERSDVSVTLETKIPPLHGFPDPGKDMPFPSFSQLITLKAFRAFSGHDRLLVDASATLFTPLPGSMELTAPSLPFVVSLPCSQNSTLAHNSSPVMHIQTDPLPLTRPNTTIHIHGHAVTVKPNSFPSLSSFVTSYLNGESPRIFLSTPLLPAVSLNTVFPVPDPRPQILQNVTIKNMKIRPLPSGTMLASGKVSANVVLPKGINVSLQVDEVYPQLLVYDGSVPGGESIRMEGSPLENDNNLPKPMPMPDPLPVNAFAHIRPSEWLDSSCVPLDPESGEGLIFMVSAKIIDVPLEVLPGRQREFSNFLRKAIFSGGNGALAGISGIAAVRTWVSGLGSHELQLEGLPFCGDVRIGKKALFDRESA